MKEENSLLPSVTHSSLFLIHPSSVLSLKAQDFETKVLQISKQFQQNLILSLFIEYGRRRNGTGVRADSRHEKVSSVFRFEDEDDKDEKNKDDIVMVQGGGGPRPSSPSRGRVRRVHGGAAICGQSFLLQQQSCKFLKSAKENQNISVTRKLPQ